jgi:hypothetical protein
MRKLLALLVAIGALVCATSTKAMDANKLLSDCEQVLQTVQIHGGIATFRNDQSAGVCWGYLSAAGTSSTFMIAFASRMTSRRYS